MKADKYDDDDDGNVPKLYLSHLQELQDFLLQKLFCNAFFVAKLKVQDYFFLTKKFCVSCEFSICYCKYINK